MSNIKSYTYLSLGLFSFSILSFIGLSSSLVSADEVVDDISLTVPLACTLESTLDTAHTATITNGVYTPNIGTTTFSTGCNDSNGYAIYAIGFSNDEYGNNNMIGPNTNTIATGVATSGDTSAWAMKLIPVAGTFAPTIVGGYDNYNVVPTTYTKVAEFTSAVNPTVGSSFQSTYAAYVSSTQYNGTYTGKVKYTLVHPSSELPPTYPVTTEPGKISYNPNAPGVVDSMDDQSTDDAGAALTTGADVTLWPSNFKHSGYGFAGWNTAYDYSGTTYGPMETITTPDLSTTGLSLYAVWVPSAGDLQGWQGCDSLASGAVTALTDTRDSNVYAVAKLADGNCWMIENLRLGGNSAMNLTTANTVTAFTLPASTNTFVTDNYTTTIEMSAKNTLEAPTDMTTPTNAEVYSYGNYYSWPAAIGSTTAYSSGNQSVSTSICPSGWHLPKGGNKSNESNNEFWKLIVTGLNNGSNPANYSSSTYPYYTGDPEGINVSKLVRSYPNNFLYSGLLRGSSFNNRGFEGFYWSSTVGGANNSYASYYLGFRSSYVYPGTNMTSNSSGFSVRCVADSPDLTKISTMQEMTFDICAATLEGTEKQLRDTRDNKTYWVAKLQDGKCWMTQNLDLDLSTSKALTPYDSDVTSNWTPTRGTIDASAVTNNSISNWSNDYITPYSVNPGNWYWNALPFYSSTENNFLAGSGGTKFQ
ncbi:hypothetical protein IKF57_00565, partial [Candidatus Saccharibacteria bacterium]|nr:hypothetical protein [Candidatus Saccharibacteria bacterium]